MILFENANDAIFVAQDQKLVFFNPKTMAMIDGFAKTRSPAAGNAITY
jgi:hypothetical protein